MNPAEARRRVRRLDVLCPAMPGAPEVQYAIELGSEVTAVFADGTRQPWPADKPLPQWTKVYGFDPKAPSPVDCLDEER
jgi:hypothetical protein